MATVSPLYTRIIKNARLHLPSATDDAIKLEVFNVLHEFLEGTTLWQEDIPFTIQTNVTGYDLSSTDLADIHTLVGVFDSSSKASVPATMDVPGRIVLNTTPSTSQSVFARVILNVTDPQDTNGYPVAPDWILDKYYKDIVAGVLAAMMAQPAKPYSNPQLAILNGRKFAAGVSEGKAQAVHGQLYDGQRWRFPGIMRGRW